MNHLIVQDKPLIPRINIFKNSFFIFILEGIVILSCLTLGWKITLLMGVFLLVLFFCMINDLAYIYLIILISPLINVFGIPYETMRLLKWVLISLIIFVAIGKILLARKPFSIPKVKLNKFMLLFLGLAIVTTLFSINFEKSILGVLRASGFFVLFFLVFNTIKRVSDVKKLIGFWLSVAVVVSFYGLWQHFGEGLARVYSTFANPNGLGEFCFLTIPLVVSLGIYEKRRNLKFFYLLTFSVLVVTLFLTGSRASWLSSLVAITTVGIVAKNKRLLVLTFAFMVTVFSVIMISPAFRSISEDIVRLSSGLSYRPLIWASSLNLIKDNLFLGVGINAVGDILPQYSVATIPVLHLFLYQFLKTGATHNFYLLTVAEMGIFSLLVFLYFFKVSFTEIKGFLKKNKETDSKALLTAGLALIVGTFVHAFFELSNIVGAGSYTVYFWILLAFLYSTDRVKRKNGLKEKSPNFSSGLT